MYLWILYSALSSELLPEIALLLSAWQIYSHLLKPVSLTSLQLATTPQRATFILSSRRVLCLRDGCARQHLRRLPVSRGDSGISVWRTDLPQGLVSSPPTGRLPFSLAWTAPPPAYRDLCFSSAFLTISSQEPE